MDAPLVSVIVPAYNAAEHIGTAIASALDQTWSRLEVIVVDDVSPDSTAAVVEDWSRRDPRVRLVRAEINGGPAHARNLAIEASSGDWLAPLDSDDAFDPERIERLLEVARLSRADLIADNLRLVDGASGDVLGMALPGPAGPEPEYVPAETFVRRNMFGEDGFDYGYLKPLIRRGFLDDHGIRYREALRIGEDYHLYLDCMLAGGEFVLMREALYDYRLTAGSISRRLPEEALVRLGEANCGVIATAFEQAPVLLPVLRARQRQIDRLLTHVRFVDRVKAGRLLRALALVARRPGVLPLVVRYGRESVLKRMGVLGFHGLRVRRAGS